MASPKNLTAVACGETAFVMAVDGSVKARTRLESMGIFPGVEVNVLNNGTGPLVVSVGEGRIIVERGVAEQVLVA